MRVGLITPGFSASEQDWCIPAQLDFVRLLARRAEVAVFPLRYPHRRGRYVVAGAEVLPQGGAAVAGLRRLPLLLRAVRAVLDEHRRKPFDALHALWADEPGFVAAVAAGRLGIPAVISVCGGELEALAEIGYGGQLSRLNRLLVRYALGGGSVVTAGSQLLLDRIKAWMPDRPAALFPLGVDPARFCPEGGLLELAGGPHILHVASLLPVKDQATLLRAFAKVAAELPEAQLHLAGDGPLREQIAGQVAQSGLADRVSFHGPVDHTDLPALYRAADLCVLSSRYESQSMAALEAAACGRVTVSTAIGLLPELLPPTALAAVGDAGGLALGMLGMLCDIEGRQVLGRQLVERVRDCYTVERTVARALAFYADR